MFTPSKRQQDLFDVWEDTDDNVLVSAVAGSGKTTTLLQLLERYCHSTPTLFLAFNKSIQTEIESRLHAKGVSMTQASTLHSLGLSAIRNKYTKVYVKGGKTKYMAIAREVKKLSPLLFRGLNFKQEFKVFYALIHLNDASRMFLTDRFGAVVSHLNGMGKSLTDVVNYGDMELLWEEFVKLRYRSYEGSRVEVDFGDMLFLPVHQKLRFPVKVDYLFIDEAQDLNLCQHTLIDLLIKSAKVRRWVAVGDPHQSIYGFSGAYSDSFELFKDKPGNLREMPLDICYRCDRSIVRAANQVYDVMQAHSQEEGIVRSQSILDGLEINSMLICRSSAPLLKVYFDLLALGIPCYIEGKEILSGILNFIRPYANLTFTMASHQMEQDHLKIANGPGDTGLKEYLFTQDRLMYNCIVSALGVGLRAVGQLEPLIKKLFVGKRQAVKMCTIHKAKGLEADTVYILNEHIIPVPFARTPEQLVQEENLRYVARTRAKHKLIYLNIKTDEDEKSG